MFGSLFGWLRRLARLNMSDENQEEIRCPRRCGHISFTDGENLYVWGGHCKDTSRGHAQNLPIDEVWIYRPKFDAWVLKKSSGVFPHGTSGPCLGVVEHKLYVYCGHHTYLGHVSSLHSMNLQTFEWMAVNTEGRPISPRDKAACWVWDNKLWCFGGYGHNPEQSGIYEGQGYFTHGENTWDTIGWNNQLVMFDPAKSMWSSPECENIQNAPVPRAAHAAVVMGKDKVFIFGGRHKENRMNDLHCLDLTTLTWSGRIMTKYPEPRGRSWHTLSALDDDCMMMYGGFSQSEDVLGDLWMYSVKEEKWTELMPASRNPRGWHTAVMTKSSELLVFGGFKHNILAPNFEFNHVSDKVIKFQFTPSSLKHLCLDWVSRNMDSHQWGELPKNLREFLEVKQALQEPWMSLDPLEKARYGEHVLQGFSRPPTPEPTNEEEDVMGLFL